MHINRFAVIAVSFGYPNALLMYVTPSIFIWRFT
jgi:hypothetical protein